MDTESSLKAEPIPNHIFPTSDPPMSIPPPKWLQICVSRRCPSLIGRSLVNYHVVAGQKVPGMDGRIFQIPSEWKFEKLLPRDAIQFDGCLLLYVEVDCQTPNFVFYTIALASKPEMKRKLKTYSPAIED